MPTVAEREEKIKQKLDSKRNDKDAKKLLEEIIESEEIKYYGDEYEVEREGVPSKFCDAITSTSMEDPFVGTIGDKKRVYDISTIIKLFEFSDIATDPFNRNQLLIDNFIPFPQLKEEIEAFNSDPALQEEIKADPSKWQEKEKELLENFKKFKEECSKIFEAIEKNNFDAIKQTFSTIKDEKLFIYTIDDHKNTLLHFIIQANNLDIIKLLIDFLLEKKWMGLLERFNNEGAKPLALIKNQVVLEYFEAFIENGKIKSHDEFYQALFIESAKKSNGEFIKYLYQKPICKTVHFLAAEAAIKAGNVDALRVLVDSLDNYLMEEFFKISIEHKQLEVVKFFVDEKKIDPSVGINFISLRMENFEDDKIIMDIIFKFLNDEDGKIRKSEKQSLVEYFKKIIENGDLSNQFILKEQIRICKGLFENLSIFVISVDDKKNNLLHYLINKNDLKLIKCFLESFSNEEKQMLLIKNSGKKCPLDFIKSKEVLLYLRELKIYAPEIEENYRHMFLEAARTGNEDFFRYFYLNEKNYSNLKGYFIAIDEEAAETAIENNRLAILKILKKYLKKTKIKSKFLHISVKSGFLDIVKFFVDEICGDISYEFEDGTKLFEYALKEGNENIKQFFKEELKKRNEKSEKEKLEANNRKKIALNIKKAIEKNNIEEAKQYIMDCPDNFEILSEELSGNDTLFYFLIKGNYLDFIKWMFAFFGGRGNEDKLLSMFFADNDHRKISAPLDFIKNKDIFIFFAKVCENSAIRKEQFHKITNSVFVEAAKNNDVDFFNYIFKYPFDIEIIKCAYIWTNNENIRKVLRERIFSGKIDLKEKFSELSYFAIEHNDMEILTNCFRLFGNSYNETFKKMLKEAVKKGSLSIVKFLFEQLAMDFYWAPAKVQFEKDELLEKAAEHGHIRLVFYFVQKGAKILSDDKHLTYILKNDNAEIPQSEINALLFAAVENYNFDWVKCLVENFGANVDLIKARVSLICEAASQDNLAAFLWKIGNKKIASYLISKGADFCGIIHGYTEYQNKKIFNDICADLDCSDLTEEFKKNIKNIYSNIKKYNTAWDATTKISDSIIKFFEQYEKINKKIFGGFFSKLNYVDDIEKIIEKIEEHRQSFPHNEKLLNQKIKGILCEKNRELEKFEKNDDIDKIITMIAYAIQKIDTWEKAQKLVEERKEKKFPQHDDVKDGKMEINPPRNDKK